jgi:hypothetical protein
MWQLLLVDDRQGRQRHRRVDAAEQGDDFLLGDQLACRDHALGRHGFIVALDELELAAAEETALGIDLVDGEGEPARDRPRPTGQTHPTALPWPILIGSAPLLD